MGKLEDAKALLKSYMSAMNEWEVECVKRIELIRSGAKTPGECFRQNKEQYQEIYGKYGMASRAEKNCPRGTYCSPPEYDPDLEVVLESKELEDGSVKIRTRKNNSLKEEFVYTLKVEDGELRLFGKQFVGYEGRLVDAIL